MMNATSRKPTVVTLAVLLYTFSLAIESHAQDITGSLEEHVDSIIDNLPGNSGDNFVEPNTTQHISWEGMVVDILQGDYSAAADVADSLNYRIIQYLDASSSQLFHILEEKLPQQYY